MNRAELRERARVLSGIVLPTVWSDADFDLWIDEAYAEFCTVEDWPWMGSTAIVGTIAGQDEYPLPASIRRVRSVFVTGADEKRRLEPSSQLDHDGRPVQDGLPFFYHVDDAGNLVLWPTPDRVEQVMVRGRLIPALADDTASPAFDVEFHPGVAYLVAVKALQAEGDDSTRPQVYADEVLSTVERMRAEYLADHDDGLFRLGQRQRRVGTKPVVTGKVFG